MVTMCRFRRMSGLRSSIVNPPTPCGSWMILWEKPWKPRHTGWFSGGKLVSVSLSIFKKPPGWIWECRSGGTYYSSNILLRRWTYPPAAMGVGGNLNLPWKNSKGRHCHDLAQWTMWGGLLNFQKGLHNLTCVGWPPHPYWLCHA